MKQYDELVWVTLWVERAAKLAAALQKRTPENAFERAIYGAIRRDNSGTPHLTVTTDLIEEAQQWRLRQRAAEVAPSTGLYAAEMEEEDAPEEDTEPDFVAVDAGPEAAAILDLIERARARRGEAV